jgi:hypothetical protein
MLPRKLPEDHLSIFRWEAFRRLPYDARGFIILVHEGVKPAANFEVEEELEGSVVALLRLLRISCARGAHDRGHVKGVSFFIARGWLRARRMKKLDSRFSKLKAEDAFFYEAGRICGVPTCCVRSFVQARRDQHPRSAGGRCPDEFRYLYYTPCSESCSESEELGRRIGIVLEGLDPGAAAKWREDPPVERIFA